jgi:hypothetical protein
MAPAIVCSNASASEFYRNGKEQRRQFLKATPKLNDVGCCVRLRKACVRWNKPSFPLLRLTLAATRNHLDLAKSRFLE